MRRSDLRDGLAVRPCHTAVGSLRAAIRGILAVVLVSGGMFAMGRRPASANHVSFGSDWVVESTIPLRRVNDVAFTSELDGWAVGDARMLAFTHDGGQTWSIKSVPAPNEVQRIIFTDPLHGYTAGQGEFLITQDGGSTWQAPSPDPGHGLVGNRIEDIAAPTSRTFIVTDNLGVVSGSDDAGVTWQALPPFQILVTSPAWVAFPSPSNGWVVRGDLWHSTDGGNTWTQATSGGWYTGPLDFVDPGTGFAISNGALAHTSDGGATWSQGGAVPGSGFIYRFLSAATGVGSDGTGVYMTTDGGATWQKQSAPGINCVVVGYRGTIPFAVDSDGTFLHYGPLPASATATATSTPAATAEPSATASATVTPVVVAPLRLTSIRPTTAVVRSQATITLAGTGLDDLVTVTIGDDDITDVVMTGTSTLAMRLPTDIGPGIYDVTVTEPDGRTATLPQALTVVPKLTLVGHVLHIAVKQGATGVVLLQAIAGAQLHVQVTTANGHAAPHILVKAQPGTRGQWRVLLAIGSHVAPGTYRVVASAHLGQQHVQITLTMHINAAGAH